MKLNKHSLKAREFGDFSRIKLNKLFSDVSGHLWLKSNASGLIRPQYLSMMLPGEINSIYFPLYLASKVIDYVSMEHIHTYTESEGNSH